MKVLQIKNAQGHTVILQYLDLKGPDFFYDLDSPILINMKQISITEIKKEGIRELSDLD